MSEFWNNFVLTLFMILMLGVTVAALIVARDKSKEEGEYGSLEEAPVEDTEESDHGYPSW